MRLRSTPFVDVVVILWDLAQDKSSRLFQALHPDHIPRAERLAIDQINMLWGLRVQVAAAVGVKGLKYEPVYDYPGNPLSGKQKQQEAIGPAGGYVNMTADEAEKWIAAKEKRQAARAKNRKSKGARDG